jgi:murein DD-endopeptidase MepM/ murein hydrolase activator NlpD
VKIIAGLGLKKHKKLSFFMAFFMFFIIPFSVANAGFLSFVGGLFNKTNSITDIRYSNSQTASILHAAINFDPNPSKGGGDITIVGESALLPETGPLGTIADVEDDSSGKNHQISVYVVREGDSLSQIAKMFGVSVNTIIWANDIGKGGIIREGQDLVILPVSGLEYTIKKGDTPGKIVKKYGGTVEELLSFNDIYENTLTVGDTIIIPNGKKSTPRYSSRNTRKVVRGTNVPAYNGYYIRPVKNAVKSQGLHGYNAVDLAAPRGTQIVAAASGKVIISRNSGWNGGYGRYIVIKHPNGTQTLYAHTSGNIVKVGWNVVQGQVIGYVGSTGRSTGPHVHFEIRGAKNPF